MAGLDSFYDTNRDFAEQGSYSSLSTPGGRSSLRQRRVVEPLHSSSHGSIEDECDPLSGIIENKRAPILHKVDQIYRTVFRKLEWEQFYLKSDADPNQIIYISAKKPER